MNEEILKKLEQKVGRRSFLKGSGLAAATLVGVFAASPLVGLAQQQPPPAGREKERRSEEGRFGRQEERR